MAKQRSKRAEIKPPTDFGINRGESNPRAKLTAEQVREIRRKAVETGMTQDTLGRIYGVTRSMINYIVNRKSWKHI